MFTGEGKRTIWLVTLMFAAVLAGDAGHAGEGDAASEAAVLRNQVAGLVEALAAARVEAEFLRARLEAVASRDDSRLRPSAAADRGIEHRKVIDVNPELMMVVIDAGRQDGIRPGMKYVVFRDGSGIAEVCVVDVRERISGASIVWGNSSRLPVAGEMAVPSGMAGR